jgi:hypothetical protein
VDRVCGQVLVQGPSSGTVVLVDDHHGVVGQPGEDCELAGGFGVGAAFETAEEIA